MYIDSSPYVVCKCKLWTFISFLEFLLSLAIMVTVTAWFYLFIFKIFLTFWCICILENIDFFQNWNELLVGFTFLLNIFILVNIFRGRKTLSICLMALWLAKTFVKWPTMFQFNILYSFHLSKYTGMENERSGDYYWFTFWSQINSKVLQWNCNSILQFLNEIVHLIWV